MQRIRLRPLVENSGTGGFKKCVKIIMEEIVAYNVVALYSWSGKEEMNDKSIFFRYVLCHLLISVF